MRTLKLCLSAGPTKIDFMTDDLPAEKAAAPGSAELLDPQHVADEVRERDDDWARENAAWTIEALMRRQSPQWRDPSTDPPRLTGKILVWMSGIGPVVVNVEENSMWTWDGDDDVTPTDPYEWDGWMEIQKPNQKQ